jgi:hypothetical protein
MAFITVSADGHEQAREGRRGLALTGRVLETALGCALPLAEPSSGKPVEKQLFRIDLSRKASSRAKNNLTGHHGKLVK